MLQPILIRLAFRVIGGALGLIMIACASLTVRAAFDGAGAVGIAAFGLLALAIGVFGILLLILAFSGSLPEWVVGDGRDEDGDATPAA